MVAKKGAINYPIVFKVDKQGLTDAENGLQQFGKIAAGVSLAVVAAVSGIVVSSVKEFAKFDAALTKSTAIMGDVSEAMRGEMSDAAREVAKNTTFSAEQAAESFFFLASAGLDAAASVKAMPQVAKFAQAGMFDMALATDLATDAQAALGLSSKDSQENLANLTRITDVFVKANTLANTSVEQLATAFTTKAGTALKTVGKDVEEGAAALALFADQGVKGELAGTQLTNTIFGLTDQARKSPAAFAKLGISVFDAEGNMRNFANIADDLGVAFEGMSTEQKSAELGALGFSKQARAGVLMLTGQGDKIREYEQALRSAGGTVDEIASKQLDTLEAQLSLLKSSFVDLALEIGGPFDAVLTGLIKNFRPLVDLLLPVIADFMLNKIAPALETAGAAFGRFSEKIQDAVGLTQPATDRLTELGIAVDDLNTAGVGFVFGDLLIQGFSKLGDFLKGSGLTDMLAKGLEFRQALLDSIMEALPGIVEAITTFIPQLLSFFATVMLPALVAELQFIVTNLVSIFADLFPQLVTSIAEMIPTVVQAIADLIPALVHHLVKQIPVLLDTALVVFNSLVDAVVLVIPLLIKTLLDLFPRVLTAILDQLPKIIDSALTLFNGLITAFIEILPMLITAIIEAVPQIVSTIVDALPLLIKGAVTLFIGLLTGFLEALPELMRALLKLVPDVVTALVGMMPELVEGALELFLGIQMGLLEAFPEILAATIDLIPLIISTLLGAIPQLVSAGAQLLAGLAKGLIDSAPRIIGEAAANVGRMVVDSFKSVFKISSPSKVFMGIGGDLVAGLTAGLEKGDRLLKNASFDMAQTFTVSSENAFAQAVPSSGPMMSSSSSNATVQNVINLSVNAGMGTDGRRVGQQIVEEIIRYEKLSGKVFARA